MSDPNAFAPTWDVDLADAPFRARAMRLALHAGAQELGATLYEIDPGGTNAPYHVHHGNEELLVVLAGTLELRTPDGTRDLIAGATVAFPRGPVGAHGISNVSDEPARVLIVSTMHHPDVAEHPDSGTVLAVSGPREAKLFPAGTDIAFLEAVARAIAAAPGTGEAE